MKASSLLRIGDRIRELRGDKNWTQKQLAEASQINEVQIRRYENNQSLPREAQLIKIANALGVDKDEFFKEKVYKIKLNNVAKNESHDQSFAHLKKSMEAIQRNLDEISKSMEAAKQTQLDFIHDFIKDKENASAELDKIANLLWIYDCLESDETAYFIYLSQIFLLTNRLGKEKLLEFSDLILGNPDYRNEE